MDKALIDRPTGPAVVVQNSSAVSDQTQILVFPSPGQGHMSPMIQFSKRLASKGVRVTLVITTTSSNSIQTHANSFKVEVISDGSEQGNKKSETIEEYLERFRRVTTHTLANLIITKIKTSTCTPGASESEFKLFVYDSSMPWLSDVAQQHGIAFAPFFTQSCAVTAIYHQFHQGAFMTEPSATATMLLPCLPPLGIKDVPSFLYDHAKSYPSLFNSSRDQFSNLSEAKCLLWNTFDLLEDEVLEWMTSTLSRSIMTIGPTIPSMFLDKRFEDDLDYSFNLYSPNVDACMKWLDCQENGSVVYVSFGSYASPSKDQMEEIAWGLKNSNYNILWVVKQSEKEKLPINFVEGISEKGLVVSWCSQLQVLAHKAVGCFVTHCGWNSILEALSLGVPMVAMPQWSDQTTNAKFIEDVWKTGVRVKVNEKLGVATRDEIAWCITTVLEEGSGMEMRKASLKWKRLAKEAVDVGGSSDKNMDELVAKLEL
ncbi:PREDICTED: UDP-glycosyltransferase 74E1-like [Fragaria vesca subsp. vesca]|uniref:UDP-glycosyltransferase 74E1-like n=1 Tax=Fragaria vesca subsp. vesca TaxID=101020 RepID=UPI0002C36F51|nr:PREDICTED: UDP-glycosyltransferase 74E1-like [Fragaria vesca subsp. vesca]